MNILAAIVIILFKTLGQVNTRDYNYVPECSDRSNLHNLVQNSLLTYYEIYRGLFCVTSNNSGRDLNYMTTLKQSEAKTRSSSLQTEFSNEQRNFVNTNEVQKYLYYTKSGTIGIFKLPKGSGAQRREIPIEWRDPYYFVRSGQIVTALSSWCTTDTLADPTYFSSVTFQSLNTKTSTAVTPTFTFHKYLASGVFSGQETPSAISLSGNVCSNQQVFTQFEITYNISDQISAVAIHVYWIASIDYGTTGSVLGTFGFDILNKESGTIIDTFYANGTPGYNMTDPTIIGKNSTPFTGITAEIPVFLLSVADRDGNCLPFDSSGFIWSDRNSVIEFGKSKLISCKYTATSSSEFETNCANLNIYNVDVKMTAWAKYGIADVNYQSDWIQATVAGKPTFTASTTSCIVIRPNINVFYQRFGKVENPRYQISKVDISFTTITLTYSSGTTDYDMNMAINWYLISSDKDLYKPGLPSAKTYIANDVLYPFYVARSYININFYVLSIVTFMYQIN